MGKRIVLFTTVLGACAGGQVVGMENQSTSTKPSLNFYLSNGLKIKGYSADGMEFFKKPSNFKGQSLLETIPLDKSDKLKLQAAFALARRTDKKITEKYTLDQVTFLATITPLVKGKKGNKKNFFVEVEQANQAQTTDSQKSSTEQNTNSVKPEMTSGFWGL